MGLTSDACWFLVIKTLLIKNNKKREAALKNEAGGDEKHVFFLLGLTAGMNYLGRPKLILGSACLKRALFTQKMRIIAI